MDNIYFVNTTAGEAGSRVLRRPSAKAGYSP
jgi:hypothetical protein